MELRPLPVLISVAVTSAVLFGGWFAYRSLAMENPLSETVHGIPGVVKADMTIDSDTVHLELALEPDADLRAIMAQIREEGQDIIEDRNIELTIDNNASPELDGWWSRMLFDVAEAMEHRRYSDIPKTLNANKDLLEGLSVHTSMDDENVYIRLNHGNHSKFVVLPREPAMLGVWSHE